MHHLPVSNVVYFFYAHRRMEKHLLPVTENHGHSCFLPLAQPPLVYSSRSCLFRSHFWGSHMFPREPQHHSGTQKTSISTGGFIAEDGDVRPAALHHKFTNQPSSLSSSLSSSRCAQRGQKGPHLGRLSARHREETWSLQQSFSVSFECRFTITICCKLLLRTVACLELACTLPLAFHPWGKGSLLSCLPHSSEDLWSTWLFGPRIFLPDKEISLPLPSFSSIV